MKDIRYSKEKDEILRKTRGIGFEEISEAILSQGLIKVIDNPSKRYPGQKIFVLKINNYIYAAPFVETEEEIFLKTIYPSRQYRKRYSEEISKIL